MGILDLFGKKDVSSDLTKKIPYLIKYRFSPYRLLANQNNSVRLFLDIKNATGEPLMTSVVVKVPKGLGFDQTCLSQAREIRMGNLAPKEEKEIEIDVFGRIGTRSAEYKILITAFSHYRDYAHILNSESKKVGLRVV
ncbi:MAG: hypothetical protein ABIG39_00230 [Candidatus Micrarchaeota archaeon]